MDFDIVILSAPAYMESDGTVPKNNVILEDKLVADAFKEQGLLVARKSWDDPDFDWSSTRCAMFRSTWDYINRVPNFMRWLQTVSKKTQLINSKKLILWNIDKHYLQDLQQVGIIIPKTIFIEKGSLVSLQHTWKRATEQNGFKARDLVLKPCISGGARHTYKIQSTRISEYEEIFQELIAEEAMMVQEFQLNIVDQGEMSIMVFCGQFTHAVLKKAKPGEFRVQDDFGGSVFKYKPTEEEIRFAETIVKMAPELPIYARVDIFRDNNEQLTLAELEIFEPELWFRLNPKAAGILAGYVCQTYFN